MNWDNLVTHLPCFVVIVDRDCKVVKANKTFSGKRPTDMAGTKFLTLVHPGDRGVVRALTMQVLQKNRCFRAALRDLEGTPHDVEFGPVKSDYGAPASVACVWIPGANVPRTEVILTSLEDEIPSLPPLRLQLGESDDAPTGPAAVAATVATVIPAVTTTTEPAARQAPKLDYAIVYDDGSRDHAARLRRVFDWTQKECALWLPEEFPAKTSKLQHKPRMIFLGNHKYTTMFKGLGTPKYDHMGALWNWQNRQATIWQTPLEGNRRTIGETLEHEVSELYAKCMSRNTDVSKDSDLPGAKKIALQYLELADAVTLGPNHLERSIRHRQYTLAITSFLLQGLRKFSGLRD